MVSYVKPAAVANTTVNIQIGIDNYLINLFTFGFVRSRKVVVEADLMKVRK